MRHAPLILLALFIDGLQAALSWGFFAVGSAFTAATPIGGAGIGCAIGATMSNGVVATATNCVRGAFVGAFSGALGIPLGIGLGFVTDVCLSATLGAGLIMLLIHYNMFYPKYVVGGGLLELIPGLDALPGWTFMTVACVIQKTAQEKNPRALVGAAVQAVAGGKSTSRSVVPGPNQIRPREAPSMSNASGNTTEESRETSHKPITPQLQNIDGIRPPSQSQPSATSIRPRTVYAA